MSTQLNTDEIIPLSEPHLSGKEWKYIKDCLDTNWVSYLGHYVDRFEMNMKKVVHAKYAVATQSGTAALHISLIIAGVKPEEEVIVPAITFVAPANAVRYCGAWPLFIDINKNNWQIDINKLSDFLKKNTYFKNSYLYNKSTKRRIAALLPVHLLGGMFDPEALGSIAEMYNLPIIEDAAESLGATFQEKAIAAPLTSSNPPVRFIVTSFNGNKIITTGGGGMIFTDNYELYKMAKHLTTTAKVDSLTFFHDQVGYNYRMTNIAAAMGVAQLEKLMEYVNTKRSIAKRYKMAFENLSKIVTHREPINCKSTFWLYTIMLDQNALSIIKELNKKKIMVRPIWTPPYRLPYLSNDSFAYKCEFSEFFYEHALCLPSSVGLTEKMQEKVIDTLSVYI